MPSYDAERQALNRIKKKVLPQYPPKTATLADIILPDFLLATLDENSFLIYDSGVNDPNRFFMFGTEKNLMLKMKKSWFFLEPEYLAVIFTTNRQYGAKFKNV
ncbi:unnamed protein product [Brachionus calyciflorus]|uniref:Uncharacterized protein n=1 Tax=Brachionus calyciflorus TaxID=104777 RepID=A0A814N9X0_9BILA|nr:unnamed protein product [Brachionus calyciflorus]